MIVHDYHCHNVANRVIVKKARVRSRKWTAGVLCGTPVFAARVTLPRASSISPRTPYPTKAEVIYHLYGRYHIGNFDWPHYFFPRSFIWIPGTTFCRNNENHSWKLRLKVKYLEYISKSPRITAGLKAVLVGCRSCRNNNTHKKSGRKKDT